MSNALPTKRQLFDQKDSTFRLKAQDGEESFDLVLDECVDLHDSASQETFSLRFRAPSTMRPEQMTYTLRNDALGDLELFLVPVDRDKDAVYFEALFNRLKG